LGVIGVSQFMLRPQIEEIRTTRDHNKAEWDKTTASLKKTNTILKATIEKLTKTEASLEETKGQLVATTAKFETEQKRANGLQETVNKLNVDLKAVRDDLAAWTNSGARGPEEVKGLVSSVKTLLVQNDGLKEENKLLANKVKKQEDQIAALTSKETDPPVPREVRGKVLVVDPKWDFLVLDVGTKVGVPDRGVLLVSRNGELIAKVRVTNPQDQRSIANIMPGWKLKDVMEGDVVLPY
jgi:predicted nuclease with TOPRIM domain